MGLIAASKIDFVPRHRQAPLGSRQSDEVEGHRLKRAPSTDLLRAAHNGSNLRLRCLPIGLTRAQIAGRFRS